MVRALAIGRVPHERNSKTAIFHHIVLFDDLASKGSVCRKRVDKGKYKRAGFIALQAAERVGVPNSETCVGGGV